MWYFWFLFHIIILHTCFRLYGLLQEINNGYVEFTPSFYCEDCSDRGVILFNFRICVCECPVGVKFPLKPLDSADVLFIFACIYKDVLCVCVCVCVCARICLHVEAFMYTHPYRHILKEHNYMDKKHKIPYSNSFADLFILIIYIYVYT